MQPEFIGDELTAAGYRLVGFAAYSPPLAQAARLIRERIAQQPPLLLITAEYAEQLEADWLDQALAVFDPPLGIVVDAAGRVPVHDMAERIQGVLGITP